MGGRWRRGGREGGSFQGKYVSTAGTTEEERLRQTQGGRDDAAAAGTLEIHLGGGGGHRSDLKVL